MAGNSRSGDRRSVAEKVFAIADAFDGPGNGHLTLTEIAVRANVPLSTAHRLVDEWMTWGGLVREDDGRYRLSMKLWRLGVRAPEARKLRALALPFLEDLYEVTRQNVHLAVLDNGSALYLEHLTGAKSVRVISEVGTRLPLHATGVGLVLLAYAPEHALADVLAAKPKKYLPNTLTTERELRQRLADIRSTGLAVSVNEMTPDSFSAAAPVRDRTGTVIAAVSVVAHAARQTDPQVALAVRLAALGISRAHGWQPAGSRTTH